MKSKTTAALLAFFLGGIGIHKFYLGKNGVGIVFLLFCWTFIPSIIAFVNFVQLLAMSDEEFNHIYNTDNQETSKRLKSSEYDALSKQEKANVKFANQPVVNLIKLGIAGCLAFVIIFFIVKPKDKIENASAVDNSGLITTSSESKLEPTGAISIDERIDNEIKSIGDFDGSKFRDDVTNLQIELALFKSEAKTIELGENSDNKATVAKAKKLRKIVQNLQKKEYPLMRKAYTRIIHDKLWENDIEVTSYGKDITFVGGIYAANKNKQETENALQEMMNLLRFNRVNYKWYQYDDNYTSYNLDSKEDTYITSEMYE